MKYSIAISSYPAYSYHYCNATGANKVDILLDSIDRWTGQNSWRNEIVICADYSPAEPVGPTYEQVVNFWEDKFPNIKLIQLDNWGNMQATFTEAINSCTGDVIIFLSDDVIVTPGTIDYIKHFWERNDLERLKCGAQRLSWIDVWYIPGFEREDFYREYYESWYKRVLRDYRKSNDLSFGRIYTPHIHTKTVGPGFVFKKELWEEIGGIDQELHMFDEDFSFRLLTKTDRFIYALPNPPLIHFGAGSQAGSDDPNVIHAHDDALELAKEKWGVDYYTHERFLADLIAKKKKSLPKTLVKGNSAGKDGLGWYINGKQLNLL